MNAKTYYSSFIPTNADNDDYHRKDIPCSRSNSSCFDTNIPSLFYRIGSVGQDNRLCFWDITEDILKINKHPQKSPLISSTLNGYSSFLSDTTTLNSTDLPVSTTKSSFSSLTSRLSFSRNSNKIQKSVNDTPDSTHSNGSVRKSRKIPLLSHTASGSKSTISNDSGQESLSTVTNNSLSSRQTNIDLTKSTFGTNLCPRLDDIQVIEPILTEFISHERLNGIFFSENCFLTSAQDGIISIWEKPQKILPIDDRTTNSTTLINSNSHHSTITQRL